MGIAGRVARLERRHTEAGRISEQEAEAILLDLLRQEGRRANARGLDLDPLREAEARSGPDVVEYLRGTKAGAFLQTLALFGAEYHATEGHP